MKMGTVGAMGEREGGLQSGGAVQVVVSAAKLQHPSPGITLFSLT